MSVFTRQLAVPGFVGKLKLSVLASAFVILNIADALLTSKLCAMGFGNEGNPIMQRLLGHSLTTFQIGKLIASALILLLLLLCSKRFPNQVRFILFGVVVVMIAVCITNTISLITATNILRNL